MSTFSPSEVAVEGFRVVRRHWRAAVGWAGFQIVSIVALCVLLVVLLFAVVPFAGSREEGGAIGGALGSGLLGLGGGLVEIVIVCGLFRLMLRPGEPGFMHLRIGRDEARVLGASLLLALVGVSLLAVSALFVVLIGRASPILAVLAAVLVLVGDGAILLRLGLTPVIAFAEGRISPSESWRRTRGQTWRLLGMALLLLCLMGMFAVVVWLTTFIASGLLTGFHDLDLTDRETLSVHPGRFLFQVVAGFALTPLFLVIGKAPWVAIYRALAPEDGR